MAFSTDPCCGDLPPMTAMLLSATAFQNTTAFVSNAGCFDSWPLSHGGVPSLCAKAMVAVKTAKRQAVLIIVFLISLLLFGDFGTRPTGGNRAATSKWEGRVISEPKKAQNVNHSRCHGVVAYLQQY